MVDTERSLLYVLAGFLGGLFIMKSVRALRPASASAMSLPNQQMPYYSNHAENQKIYEYMR